MNPTTQAKLDRMADIKSLTKVLDKEFDELKASLDFEFVEGDRIPTKGGFIRVSRNARFNNALAQKVLLPELYRGICTMQPDLELAKKVLTGSELEECYKVSAPRVEFVKVSDFDD